VKKGWRRLLVVTVVKESPQTGAIEMTTRRSPHHTTRDNLIAAARFLAGTLLREAVRWLIDREFGDDE